MGTYVNGQPPSTFMWYDGTIPAFDTSVIISHGLGVAPTGYLLTALDDYASLGGLKVTEAAITTITVGIANAQPVDATFKVGVTI